MAQVVPYQTADGRRYRVRYRTPDRRQTDKRGFRTKREAELFAATVEVSKPKASTSREMTRAVFREAMCWR